MGRAPRRPVVPDLSLLLFNFTLGAVAFFSPCGFPMLPAYLAYYLPREGEGVDPRPGAALARGLGGGALAALGAFLVLTVIGVAAAWIGPPFKERVLHLELVGGLVVLGLGILVLMGKGPSMKLSLRPSTRRGALGIFSFGALYAGVAASCVAPLYLSVLFQALAAPTVLDGAMRVGAYALGLASLLVLVTVLVTTSQHHAVRALKRILPHVERVSGVVLVAVGLYLIAYWARVAL